jgi:hypothetical protein
MKKTLRVMMVCAAGLLLSAAAFGQSPLPVIERVEGTVEVKAPGQEVWQAASAGQELDREAVVSTGFKSSALIRVGNSTVLVRPLSRLHMGSVRPSAAGADMMLQAGRVRADVKPPAGGKVDFTLRSSIATASVRGTAFEFDTVNLTVEEGTVRFSGADDTAVYVAAGQTAAPDPLSGKAAAPVETAAAQAPPPPAGVEEIAAPPAVIPGAASQAPAQIGIQWAE